MEFGVYTKYKVTATGIFSSFTGKLQITGKKALQNI